MANRPGHRRQADDGRGDAPSDENRQRGGGGQTEGARPEKGSRGTGAPAHRRQQEIAGAFPRQPWFMPMVRARGSGSGRVDQRS